MIELIKFEKVSYEQFEKDCKALGYECNQEIYDNIKLPTRATIESAGYDFYTPVPFTISKENNVVEFVTGIRIIIPAGVALLLLPKSGIGFKTNTTLANTVGLVDADYWKSDNEGHIKGKFVYGFSPKVFNAGDKIMQGIIIPYLVTDDDKADGIRNGGFGSTGDR